MAVWAVGEVTAWLLVRVSGTDRHTHSQKERESVCVPSVWPLWMYATAAIRYQNCALMTRNLGDHFRVHWFGVGSRTRVGQSIKYINEINNQINNCVVRDRTDIQTIH